MTVHIKRFIIKTVKFMNYLGSGASIRLTWLTGKSPYPVHPKHIVQRENPDYFKYFKPEDLILDVGSENGERDFKIAPLVKKIIGFDYDEKLVERARKSAELKNIENVEFMLTSAEEKFPFENNLFDKVIFLDVIEHLYNDDRALKEIYRVLKSDGIAIITAPNSETSWKKFQREIDLNSFSDPDHKREYSKEELENKMIAAGFKIVSVTPVVYDTPFYGLIDFIGGIHLGLYKKLQNWKKEKAVEQPEESIGFEIILQK